MWLLIIMLVVAFAALLLAMASKAGDEHEQPFLDDEQSQELQKSRRGH